MTQQYPQTQVSVPNPPAEFWQALLLVREVAFSVLQFSYQGPHATEKSDTCRWAINIVDCYLDVAMSEGWLDDVGQ